MTDFTFNLLHNFEPKRDSYGFALRPQYAQRYREYSLIYKKEENERSDKWRSFIEQVATSSQASSSENKHKEILKAESNEVKEEGSPHRVSNGDDSSGSESEEVEGTNAVSISEADDSNRRKSVEGNEIIERTNLNRVNRGGDSSRRTSSGSTEIEKGTDLGRESEGDDSSSRKSVSDSPTGNDSAKGRDSEGDDSSSRKSVSDSLTGNDSAKELPHSEEIKTRKVQHWAEIRPSLTSIEEILSFRVKKGKNMKGQNINGNDGHLPSIEESEPVEGSSDENIQEEVRTNEILDGGISGLREENNLFDQDLPELFSPWKELESLVQGGVPKDLRGEVWQAFVGVKTRRCDKFLCWFIAASNARRKCLLDICWNY